MSLSMTSDLKWFDIHEIKILKELKVFLLIGITDEKLVIKNDAVGGEQIKGTNRIVKTIDRSARLKLLSPTEVFALEEYIHNYNEMYEFYDTMPFVNHPLSHTDKAAVAELKKVMADGVKYGTPWVKMDAMRLHNLESALTERGNGNKTAVRSIASALKADGGLELLGEIVALDMFVDNTDRFYPDYNETKKFGPFEILCRVCVNPGNVMLAVQSGGNLKLTALDFVDPQSKLKTYNSDLSNCPAGLQAISNKSTRKKFAENIVEDLESFLHPKRSRLSLTKKLGMGAASRVDKGIVQGSKKIKLMLGAKYGAALPGNLAARVALMP